MDGMQVLENIAALDEGVWKAHAVDDIVCTDRCDECASVCREGGQTVATAGRGRQEHSFGRNHRKVVSTVE
jgi:hypothetical protein